MAFDAGLDTTSFSDASAVDKLIIKMEEHFDLVLIAEQMERSLVLLADLLCWPLDDVVSLRPEVRPTAPTTLSDEQRGKLRALNAADCAIYEHFNKTLRLRTRRLGQQRMTDGLRQLRTRTQLMVDQCVGANASRTDAVKADAPEICRLMATTEEEFTDMIRKKQVERFAKYLKRRTTAKESSNNAN